MFVYKCQYIHTNKKICNKPIHSHDEFSNHPDKFRYCKRHFTFVCNVKKNMSNFA
jgi:hypothetical protein